MRIGSPHGLVLVCCRNSDNHTLILRDGHMRDQFTIGTRDGTEKRNSRRLRSTYR